ncbi:hypothetical protein EI94DRAFT_1802036 [Lactarius quietus]|nr:hypothetical protein EI94DRAFT_1802036 [Lactarius quietus]
MALYLSETTLFYHQLRVNATHSPSVTFPTTKVTAGLINNWFDEVVDASRSTPSLSNSSSQPRGLELDNDNIVSSLAPEHGHEAGIPELNTSLKRKFNADSTPSPVPSESRSKRSHKQLLPLPPGAAVVQHLCEWRTSFRSATNAMLIQFFVCSANKAVFKLLSFRKTWAEQMLFEYNFVYEVIEEDERSSLMRAPFILQVFAVHLNRIVGAIDVPGLKVAGSDKDASVVVKYLPIGALALAVATVERTLQHCANGEMRIPGDEPVDKRPSKPTIKAKAKLNPQTRNISSVESHFSADNWGSATKNYIKSILKMEDGSLEIIESLAKEFMLQSKIHRELSTHESEVHAFTEDDDPHACLV